MKATVLQEELSKSLNISSRFVNPRAQLPILGNILFKTSGAKLFLTATNLEMSISTSCGAKVDEEGSLAIPAKTISEIVGNLSRGQVIIETKNENVLVESQGFTGEILGVNPNDFPSIPNQVEEQSLKFFTQDFLDSLSQVLFAVSDDSARPVLTGVLFVFEKEKLTLVATDGFRLSQRVINIKGNESFSLILPKNALMELGKIATGSKEILFAFKKQENQAIFAIGETILTTRIIEGEFPNFEKIIPKTKNVTVSVDKAEFLRSVKLASIFAREASNAIKLSVKKGFLEISAQSTSQGRQKNSIEAKVEGEEMDIVYNYKFLEDFLNSTHGEDVVVELVDSSSPGVFRDVKREDFLHLIMPVKI